MSNASLKEQLQAVASQITKDNKEKKPRPKKQPVRSFEKVSKPKPKWLDYVQYGVELLKVYFPKAFRNGNDVKPLKKGIKQDLVKRLSTIDSIVTEDKACMVKSLSYYVNTMSYHKCVVENEVRIDLNGSEAGTVTAEGAKYSAERHQAKLQSRNTETTQKPSILPIKESKK